MEIEIDVNSIRRSARQLLLTLPPACDRRFLEEFLARQSYTESHVKSLFSQLSARLLDGAQTCPIGSAYEQCVLLLLSSAVPIDEQIDDQTYGDYQYKCVALAKLMRFSVDARRYANYYFRDKPAPFQLLPTSTNTPKNKKTKVDQKPTNTIECPRLAILECCHQLLVTNPSYFKELWNWSTFVQQHWGNHQPLSDLERMYSHQIMSILTQMTATQLSKLNRRVPLEVQLAFDAAQTDAQVHTPTTTLETKQVEKPLAQQVLTIRIDAELITNIEGVLLPIFNRDNYKFYTQTDGNYDTIVQVDSTKVNLRSIALGISSGKAICLAGSVGCGKTTLVEYLARRTGRIRPKQRELQAQQQQQMGKENKGPLAEGVERREADKAQGKGKKRKTGWDSALVDVARAASRTNGFLRIQLGDQTDSKMLLGQYRCTDVPGEFIWLPGVLTQAVMNGYWLLLEDLDAATQDTYTILSGLLENKFLSVPGFRDCVKIEPGFQLFVTVRTNNKSFSNAGQKSLLALLDKYLYTINILPLSRNELCKVVSINYPKLSTVANRIVDVFLTFSSGDHASADNLRQQETHDKADTTENYLALPFEEVSLAHMPNSGRLVSTRDLIKLCERSNPMFSVTSAECAHFVFQNAVDVFCSYVPQGKEKTKLITSIGAKLGIIQSRCEYLADEYKPEVAFDAVRIKVGRAELPAKVAVVDGEDEEMDSTTNGDEEADTRDERLTSDHTKRQKLTATTAKSLALPPKRTTATFSFTRMASCILERIAVCVSHAEPVLLVGETGVGKTSAVQYLAERTQHKLVVVNMNNQSDVSDLVGGFKPVDLTYVIAPLRSEFEILFRQTFNQQKNETFLTKFSICYNQGNFAVLVKLMIKVMNTVFEKHERRELRESELVLLPRWQALKVKLLKLNTQLSKSINISFAFIPGSLVNCIKNGDWVLLDEINLASAETLECLSTILEPDGSVVLLEKGDFTPVRRHADFRIFACMNPNTDIGKKDLSVGIRNRFTEFFVDELTTDADLSLLISDYLSNTGIQKRNVSNLVRLYKRLKELSRLELNDGLGNRPVFSLRTLCRSLRVCAKNLCGSIERNLYESFCMSFLTQLDATSHGVVLQLIKDAMLSNAKAVLKQSIPKPGENYLNFEGYWIQQGPKELQECSNYILTESVRENLKDLSRIISIGKLPVLLQGPTSAGKTSLIEYVGRRSGNHCLRINNHEHTDLQEYIGTYAADVSGKLSFKEGVLVQAMRNGYWIILDELNLASTDILEALNRVLDDNRELFIPETQTVVKAHPNFMLFATQNPPGLYGGRKTLSRAFKNRFIELHFCEIPRPELEVILEKRCLIPCSYAKKMVMCMSDLQKNRKTTTKNVFTLRDLFRWGNRYTYADKKLLEDGKYDWNQHLIEEGYLVLSAKVRTAIEIEIIEETLYRNFRKRIDLASLFDAQNESNTSPVTRDIIASIRAFKERTDIVWTRNMTRMAVLTAKALQFDEPVLLVGPTGCGKTTVCQVLASIRSVQLRILNCHMHTEGADFLGGLRPCRQNSDENDEYADEQTKKKVVHKLFEWADGPLIHAMQEGSYFMADEISLAEDSVLERLNCILEPERTVLLAEKGGVGIENDAIAKDFVVQAHEGFQFMATMNPGGDFGKKELSPALRNRFTEVWCLPSDSKEDLVQIASNCMLEHFSGKAKEQTNDEVARIRRVAAYLVEVVLHIRELVEKFKFSIRDILAWANYIVTNAHLSFPEKAIFGLETIFLDALEMLPHESLEQIERVKASITAFAIRQARVILKEEFTLAELQQKRGVAVQREKGSFGIQPFFIPTNPSQFGQDKAQENFLFEAPTTKKNLFRLLSALSLQKPVLLEGPPGVGKTSIVESIGQAIGYQIVRINLCEHTDLADLFGTDLPAEDDVISATKSQREREALPEVARGGSFVWRDGPLLAALKADNTWILLDELNLAPQSVLEGLNAILDHRGEVYIPELNKTFTLNKRTRIFACQNPLKQGGGRKGLPQSFLNRFNKVYLRKLATEDLLFVVRSKYEAHFGEWRASFNKILMNDLAEDQAIEHNLFDLYKMWKREGGTALASNSPLKEAGFDLCERLVRFSETLDSGITAMEFGYRGGPYEINLRDILRWCDLLIKPSTGFIFISPDLTAVGAKEAFLQAFDNFLLTLYERMKLVYYQRMRADPDKQFIRNAFANVFGCDAEHLNSLSEDVSLYWTDEKIYFNDIVLERDGRRNGEEQFSVGRSALVGSGESPLLLTTQREMLKNLAECVHMEKPVLMCGSTDTGKTKLIDTLCTLSNQLYNTDTIDDSVTGSFQQIDLNRHLEDISQSVEGVLTAYLQKLTFAGESAVARQRLIDLLSVWSDYVILTKTAPEFTNTTAMSEELLLFRQRTRCLENVITELLTPPLPAASSSSALSAKHFQALLAEQQQRLGVLKTHTDHADSLNTGGSFEWVDSKIVKSLKCGQYILLEHVNLSSSAVLDRLNPIFEPNGKLMISEKGVASNQSAEIVEKTPNFRAFLTIDPRNGELSRAMRNRCVELSLVKESYDVDDLRGIVHDCGIHDLAAIKCILAIHHRIVHISEISVCTVSHLTRFAFLVASYRRIGYAIERAIYVSAMEVYVYAATTDLLGYGLAFYQNKLREIVLAEGRHFESLKNSTAAAAHEQTLSGGGESLAVVRLKSGELNDIKRVKLQIEPLRIMLQHQPRMPQAQLAAIFAQFEQLNLSNIEGDFLIKHLIYLLYESSSVADVELRACQLRNVLRQTHSNLLELSEDFHTCLKLACNAIAGELPQLPWNRRLFPRLRDYAVQTPEEAISNNQKSLNLSAQLIARLLLADVPQQGEGSMKIAQMTALAYSQAIGIGTVTDKLNNAFLQLLAPFLKHLRDTLKDTLTTARLDVPSLIHLNTALLWFNRLIASSNTKLFVLKEINEDVIPKLLLHFKWLEKNLLQLLAKIAENYQREHLEFDGCLQKLSHYVLSVKPPLNLMRKVYTKQLTQYQPFYRDQQITLNALQLEVDCLLSAVPSYGSYTSALILRKFQAQYSQTAQKCRAMLTNATANEALRYKFTEIELKAAHGKDLPKELIVGLQLLAAEVNEINEKENGLYDSSFIESELQTEVALLRDMINSNEESLQEAKLKDIELRLLPLKDYYFIKDVLRQTVHTSSGPFNMNMDFWESMPNLSIAALQLIQRLALPMHDTYAKAWQQLMQFLAASKEVDQFAQMFEHLNGSYRQLATYQRLLASSVQSQQMDNLATRLDCTLAYRRYGETEIDCRFAYEGPPLTNTLISLLFQNDGNPRAIPLQDLNIWRQSLQQARALVWHNSSQMTPISSALNNNLKSAQSNASKLLHEVQYVRRWCEHLENENFSDHNKNFYALVQALALESANVRTVADVCLQYQYAQYHGSMLNTLIGAIELCTLTFTPLIDPVEKMRLKNLYLVEDINCLSTMTTAYDFMRIVMKYKHFGAEIYDSLENRLKAVRERQQKYVQKVALRPEKCLYNRLVQDITHFLQSNCDPRVLLEIVEQVREIWTRFTGPFLKGFPHETLEKITEILSKIELWIVNALRFMNHILKPYIDHYQDFLQPLQCSVNQMRFGFEGLKTILTQIKTVNFEQPSKTLLNYSDRVYRTLINIGEFPAAFDLNIFNVQSSQDILQNRAVIFRILENIPNSEFDYFNLIKAKLAEVRNRLSIAGQMNEVVFRETDFAFNICNQIWQQEEERRRKKQAEENSLYVTKTKCETEDEELLELQEVEETFPTNVEEDFGDFILEDTLEKVMKLDKKKNLKIKCAQVVGDEDYAFIMDHFLHIMLQYTHVRYHNAVKSAGPQPLQLIEPFQKRMKVFVKVFNYYRPGLNEWIDEMAYNSFAFAIGLQQQLLNSLSLTSEAGKVYNFYKDSNISEIITCTELLDRIAARVDEELLLYPEQAALRDINGVIERIRGLPATSTVARFNTGFQILRQKISLWNELAHKNNHLRQEEHEVAEYVQKWTKLELQFWRNCLSQTSARVEATAYKYWFFIYNLFQQYRQDNDVDASYTDIKVTEKRFADSEVLDDIDVAKKSKLSSEEIIRIIKQFLEASTYGDFHVRLQLIFAFELYLHNMDVMTDGSAEYPSHTRRMQLDLIAGLHNLQMYFVQFSAEIEESKKTMRAPIEKKLKQFVKIESYNKDLSYFSMRSNVARVHRQLNKFLKEYQLALQQKIAPLFQPREATSKEFGNDNKSKDAELEARIQYHVIEPRWFVAAQKLREQFAGETDALPIQEESLVATEGGEMLLPRVGKLFATSRNVVKETVTHAQYPKLIIALETVFSDQLDRLEHLRAATVDRTRERPKQISEAKHILQQKRKGLSDLFKTLTQLGLSFKSGLMELSLATEFENFTLPPFCVKALWATQQHSSNAMKDKRLSANLLHLNENLNSYYAKSVLKLRQLQNIMLAPLSELGPPNIDRIKGYAIDMFLLVQRQRQLLASTTNTLYDLSGAVQQLKDLADICTPSEGNVAAKLQFNEHRETYLRLKDSVYSIRYVIEQFQLLLRCVPDQQNEQHVVCPTLQDNTALCQSSPQYAMISKLALDILDQSKRLHADMAEQDKEFLSHNRIKTFEKSHKKLVDLVKKLAASFRTPNAQEYLPCVNSIVDLLSLIEENFESAESNNAIAATPFENVDKELESILRSALLALQKLYKKYPKLDIVQINGELKATAEEEEKVEDAGIFGQIEDHHLKQKLFGELQADLEILAVQKLSMKLQHILLNFKHTSDSADKLACLRRVITLLPIIEQYQLMANYYLLQLVGTHKISVKMLSVMLTVFVELSTKGFCMPPDLMQDEEGQAKNEQKEGEGFGLEDGTGEKDASDKIESEDQLDDAKRPEDRKDEKDKEQNDCKEEKGIEMSDDFEGKMQDIEKPEDEEDDSGKSEDEEELNKEMGETEEGAEKLDDQIWGDDEEKPEEEEEEQDMNDEEGKGSKDEKDAHNDLDAKNDKAKNEDGQEEHDQEGLDATNEPSSEDKRKQQEKDIDNMKDPEVDEDQANTVHNELEEPPEAEEMDLGDMNNADEENEQGEDPQGDDNPFDIDAMKENIQLPEEMEDDNNNEEGKEDDKDANEAADSDSETEEPNEAGTEKRDETNEDQVQEDDEETEKGPEEAETQRRTEEETPAEEEKDTEQEERREEKPEDQHEQSKDKSSKEENVQTVPETENKGSADEVQSEETEKDVKQDQKLDEQETGEEKDGVGQAENEDTEKGHQGIAETKDTVAKEERKNEKQTQEKRKQGRTNEERTLGEAEKNKLKQLKTIEKLKEDTAEPKEQNEEPSEEKEAEAEEYQHVKEPKSSDKTTLDNATEEQSKQIKHDDEHKDNEEEEANEDEEKNADQMDLDAPEEEPQINEDLEELSAEKLDRKSDKPSKTEKSKERTEVEPEEMEVEGEIVDTMTVARGDETTAHCNKEILLDQLPANTEELTAAETLELRRLYHQQLTTNKTTLPDHDDHESWQTISHRMSQNARELCEQLRLILEPTKCTRLKGDYRTGRRINMKKIIPYIASQFRKDKIWLRRTKPAQRDYKITIAIDDSKSMHHNNSKTLTLEAISLVSQALTLLESGRLSILSFGEQPQLILNNSEQFDGPKLVNALDFAQNKTKIAAMLDFVRTANAEEGAAGTSSDNGLFENLLLILSDGRNIYSEGKARVRNAIKLARLQRIFLVYIIIDNPENKNSILDIQTMEMLPDKSINIKSYLDDFPFPYYVIVRDLNQLPLVLSEAMRQWFELVNSEQ